MNTRVAISDLFSREEITDLTAKSDLHGSWAVFSTWAVIGGTFAAVASSWESLPAWGKLLMCIAAQGVAMVVSKVG